MTLHSKAVSSWLHRAGSFDAFVTDGQTDGQTQLIGNNRLHQMNEFCGTVAFRGIYQNSTVWHEIQWVQKTNGLCFMIKVLKLYTISQVSKHHYHSTTMFPTT